jgi:hypothetical protein
MPESRPPIDLQGISLAELRRWSPFPSSYSCSAT